MKLNNNKVEQASKLENRDLKTLNRKQRRFLTSVTEATIRKLDRGQATVEERS